MDDAPRGGGVSNRLGQNVWKGHENVFEHVISLGYFCSVAIELENVGLREKSYPFDWLISEWHGVEHCMKNGFSGFLDRESLHQSLHNPMMYKNTRLGIMFFHDFDQYASFDQQIQKVEEKYQRRIQAFYAASAQPTLFVRYVKSEEEAKYLEENHDQVMDMIKRFHPSNEILFVYSDTICCQIPNSYPVEPDKDAKVAKRFFEKNGELEAYFRSDALYDPEKRATNLKWHREKQRREATMLYQTKTKMVRGFQKTFCKPYRHEQTVE